MKVDQDHAAARLFTAVPEERLKEEVEKGKPSSKQKSNGQRSRLTDVAERAAQAAKRIIPNQKQQNKGSTSGTGDTGNADPGAVGGDKGAGDNSGSNNPSPFSTHQPTNKLGDALNNAGVRIEDAGKVILGAGLTGGALWLNSQQSGGGILSPRQ